MSLRNTKSSYGPMSKSLHWLIMILVLIMLLVGATMGYIPITPLRHLVYTLHKFAGLTVLVLMIFFAIWTLFNHKPAYPSNMSPWQVWLAKAVRIGFYISIIAMPLIGWIFSTASGHPPSLFGLATLPEPGIGVSKTLASIGGTLHEIFAWIIFGLIVLHAAGVFVHHFIYRDNIVQRMIMRNSSELQKD